MNFSLGVAGMAIFFTLSGFLITRFLLRAPSTLDFLARRIARIVPLAWLYVLITLTWLGASGEKWIAHLFFFANLPPYYLGPATSHLWSLCLEMQFYIAVAIWYLLFGIRGLVALPFFGLAITGYRALDGVYVDITPWSRGDEILAGCALALVLDNTRLPLVIDRLEYRFKSTWLFVPLLVAFLLSCHPQGGMLNFFRPYLAAILVGWSLVAPTNGLSAFLNSQLLAYVASISYALYVIHPILAQTWLGSGDTVEKYAKRPLLFLVLLSLAHVSSKYFERIWTDLAKGRSSPAVLRTAAKE